MAGDVGDNAPIEALRGVGFGGGKGGEELLVAVMRDVARQEVASLCGLVMRRLEDGEGGVTPAPLIGQKLAAAFAEALRDFGTTEREPGL